MNLDFQLHPAQLKIFHDKSRFKVVVAGRRFGKSYLSVVMCLIEGMKDVNEYGYSLKNKDIWYVAPTFESGKRNVWRLFKELGGPLIKAVHENTGVITLINGRQIAIKGSDRPDMLRGSGIAFIVCDEYASMKPDVWEVILRPTLLDVKGGAFFIGTPAGKNHFYNLYCAAQSDERWGAWNYSSHDNPFINREELDDLTKDMSESAVRQEIDGSFEAEGGGLLRGDLIRFITQDELAGMRGDDYVTVDPAGFAEVKGQITSKLRKLDEAAIARVLVHTNGWHIREIDHGRWGVRETATRIMRAYQKSRPVALGVEKGALKNAIEPYLNDEQMRLRIHFKAHDLTHGGQRKTERISWALQGRLEKEKITILEEDRHKPWVKALIGQMFDFPNPMAHDDLIDALAYTDQIAVTNYLQNFDFGYDWSPVDEVAGY